jgi:DNA polymerase III alpha subunit (gram-positive type)
MDNIFFIDFETGGLDPLIHGVCSCTLESLDGRHIFNHTFFPQYKIYSDVALRINGHDLNTMTRIGVNVKTLIEYLSHIDKTDHSHIVLIGWNVEFDIKFLKQIYVDNDVELPRPIIGIDLCDIARNHITEVPNYKLGTIYKHYFKDYDCQMAHTSIYDVHMVRRIYEKFVELVYMKDLD